MRNGIIFGKFYPIHLGHVFMIQQAADLVEQLVLFVGCDEIRDQELFQQSTMRKMPSPQQRLAWIQEIFAYNPKISIYILSEDGIPRYPNGWAGWAQLVKQKLQEINYQADIIFSSEPQDVEPYFENFGLETKIIDHRRSHFDVSATKVRNNPLKSWHFLPDNLRGFFALNVNLLNPNSFNHYGTPYQQQLGQGLANIFNTNYSNLNKVSNSAEFEAVRLKSNKVFFSDFTFAQLSQLQIQSDLQILLVHEHDNLTPLELEVSSQAIAAGYHLMILEYNSESLRQAIRIVRSLINHSLELDSIESLQQLKIY